MKTLKRAFTGEGGSFLKVRNDEGKIDIHAVGAYIIRGLIIIGFMYLLNVLGLNIFV